MSSSNMPLRDRLLQLEEITPKYREKYEKEMQAMIEKKLTSGIKIPLIAGAIFCFGFAVYFVVLAATLPRGPILARLGLLGGAIFGFVWAGLMVRILRRGTYNVQSDSAAQAGWAWCLAVFFATLFMLLAPRLPGIEGVRLILSGLVFLVGGVAALLGVRIQQSELNTRQKLLEIELRLAEIREGLEKR